VLHCSRAPGGAGGGWWGGGGAAGAGRGRGEANRGGTGGGAAAALPRTRGAPGRRNRCTGSPPAAPPGGCCGRNGRVSHGLAASAEAAKKRLPAGTGSRGGGARRPLHAPAPTRPSAQRRVYAWTLACVYVCRPPLGGERRTAPRDRTGHAQGPRPLWRQRAPRSADTMPGASNSPGRCLLTIQGSTQRDRARECRRCRRDPGGQGGSSHDDSQRGRVGRGE